MLLSGLVHTSIIQNCNVSAVSSIAVYVGRINDEAIP